jgi:putative membrane protein
MAEIPLKEYIFVFLKGLFMGACDIIPGVSGGTIALITGIYERLITAIGNIRPELVISLVRLDFRSFKSELERIDVFFLIALVAGIGLAVVSLAHVILIFLDKYTAFTFAFFFGLIMASAVQILLEIEKCSRNRIAFVFLFLGFVAGYVVAGLNPAVLGHSLPVIFVTGLIAICAMILPGISGAYITLLMNQYEFLLSALKSLSFPEIISYITGGLIGLLLFSRVLKYLLKHYHALMLAFLTGLMVGSSRMLVVKVEAAGGFSSGALAAFAAGLVLVLIMEVLKRRYKKKTECTA